MFELTGRPDLATSLDNLGGMFSALGRQAEADEVGQKVENLRTLATGA